MGQQIEIGSTVIVAKLNRQTYRPDVEKVTVLDITKTPKTTKWHLSDGSNVMSECKMWLLTEEKV